MRFHRRALATLAATMLMAGLAAAPAAPAAASHPETPQPFNAEVRSPCNINWTTGELTWLAWHPPEQPGVRVDGEVGYRPIPNCQELAPITFAEFRAFIGFQLVDREVRQVNRGNPTQFSFTLASPGSTPDPPEIDFVVIQVCRGFPPDLPSVCSDPQTYFPPADHPHATRGGDPT